ncbi:hypothetical protein MKUB_39070 [Mycobacterium kubicae]|uniref:Uncharacterized protein n=1 Tax=Mycobacterium kubicae TaxID=120959 RepID=A0ABQ1BRQ7_9MYCO|nr:hypothetical protein MKUB_39070 [Mycobacterium kubicae]
MALAYAVLTPLGSDPRPGVRVKRIELPEVVDVAPRQRGEIAFLLMGWGLERLRLLPRNHVSGVA